MRARGDGEFAASSVVLFLSTRRLLALAVLALRCQWRLVRYYVLPLVAYTAHAALSRRAEASVL